MGMGTPRVSPTTQPELERGYLYEETQRHREGFVRGHIFSRQREVLMCPTFVPASC